MEIISGDFAKAKSKKNIPWKMHKKYCKISISWNILKFFTSMLVKVYNNDGGYNMKKLIALVLVLVCVLGLVGCKTDSKNSVEDFVVMEVTENNLLVSKVGEDGQAIETLRYSVPNWFNPNTEIKEGYKITINHNGIVLETDPMQFAKISSME